jgi:hypothetical protein
MIEADRAEDVIHRLTCVFAVGDRDRGVTAPCASVRGQSAADEITDGHGRVSHRVRAAMPAGLQPGFSARPRSFVSPLEFDSTLVVFRSQSVDERPVEGPVRCQKSARPVNCING